jgi:hypothetical protein
MNMGSRSKMCSQEQMFTHRTSGITSQRGNTQAQANGLNSAVPNVLMFWDYDTQWAADKPRDSTLKPTWGHLEFTNTDRLLEILDRFGIYCCFAVVGAAALPGERPYHDPAQIKRIHTAGHEIASHSFKHEWLPGLDRETLRVTLRSSKDALEQCIGAPVVTLVPPYNQPFDYPRGLSFSLSERREAGADRVSLQALCRALSETGYRFCRVSYRPVYQRMTEYILRRRVERPSRIESISGVNCVRVNTLCGFASAAVRFLNSCLGREGIAVFHGHPHSLTLGDEQDERYLIPFLDLLAERQRCGEIRICLPSQLVEQQ